MYKNNGKRYIMEGHLLKRIILMANYYDQKMTHNIIGIYKSIILLNFQFFFF